MNRQFFFMVFATFVLGAVPAAHAHFPWLIVNEDGKAALFFGETIAEQNYKLPNAIMEAKVEADSPNGSTRTIELSKVETDDFAGRVSKETISEKCRLSTQVTYGIYHGNRLEYYASHLHGELPTARSQSTGKQSDESMSALQADVVATKSGVDVFVNWKGEPLSGTEVHLYCNDGHEEAVATTDSEGKVSFSEKEVEDGLNGIMFGHTASENGGQLGDKAYTGTMHYYTLTFAAPGDGQLQSSRFDDLPFEITSFGAARVGDMAYVYGGHTGDAHSYSTEEQSNKLLSLDLQDPASTWTVAATGPRLQGLAMIPHRSRIILIGGFTAKNAQGDEHDLHSQSTVRAFETQSKTWSELPPLPAGRSSHDAAIIGDTIYVVGGWRMAGDEETQWHSTALSLDLSASDLEWQEIASPPFQRRALATVAHRGRLYVVGGMDKQAGPTRQVAIYDPKSNSWSSGPDLIGESGMAGFGAAGWSLGGKLIVSTYEGDILRLAEDGDSWESLGKSADSRFFHRLLPLDSSRLVAVGGANMESGKFLSLEVLSSNP